MRSLSCDPRAETLGVNVLGLINAMRKREALLVMETHGLTRIQPGEWIPAQRLLDALNDLGQVSDPTYDAVATGVEFGRVMPVAISDPSLEDVLTVWDEVYQSLHRNADVGRIACRKVADRHYKVTFTDLYSDDFNYGLLYGFAQRFLPSGTQFTINYDPSVTPRDRGGQKGYTVIHIRWG